MTASNNLLTCSTRSTSLACPRLQAPCCSINGCELLSLPTSFARPCTPTQTTATVSCTEASANI